MPTSRSICCCGTSSSQVFYVTGCSKPIQGATVTVYDSLGGTSLASGSTDSSGNVSLSWSGGLSVYVTSVAAGFYDYGASPSLTQGGTTNIVQTIRTDWTCCPEPGPLPKSTLHATVTTTSHDSRCIWAGSFTLTYGPSADEWTYFDIGLVCTEGALRFYRVSGMPCQDQVPPSSFSNNPVNITFDYSPSNCSNFFFYSFCDTMSVVITS